MSDIDPQKLEEAIEDIERLCDHHAGRSLSSLRMGIAAARAHLATLPRYKEVEVEGWMVVNRNGTPVCAHQRERAARDYLEQGGVSGDQVVRLTGTAKVRA